MDQNFLPKVHDFGLAKVSNRDNTRISMTGGRGTPGYAALELWLQFSVTPKCDVYSFGMLLFEIIGRRKNHDINLPDSQEWFPGLVWKKFESKELGELMVACGKDEKDKEIAERMVNVALWCTQYRPESRPSMSVVVKMLEGDIEIPRPTTNPFQHLIPGNPYPNAPISDSSVATNSTCALDSEFSHTVTGYSGVRATPLMRKYELEIAST